MGLTIGVDIGGTKIAAGVVDEEGNILSTFKVPTPTTPEAIVDAIASAVEGARAGHEIVGVGIGAAGYVNRQRSTVYFAPNIDWRNEPLKDEVQERTGLPVVVENDANAAAWGEYRFGAGKGHRNVICITLGTGLGGGIIIGNKLRRGHFGVAAEFGHIRMVPDGLLCGCGSQGCWEQYASGRALVRYAKQRANATPERAEILLRLGDGTPAGIEGKHISVAARQGCPVAVDSYRELARWVGAGLADLASLFDPSAFIVGGGLSDEGELVLDPIRKSYKRWLVGGNWRPVADVLAARLGNKAGMVGAADLAREPDPIM
ncbi:ROK family glucokinase [Streptomyces longwoodensis]|uniref:Glucokinase n=1 Tax=Streptomyces lasalocidi TaxID=324833 RepID=A0A4U5WEV6_STRLS|nr:MULTISPECIES: ROK family glucokinase [Streptomyces]MCX4998744.1 ROK family glucokinase [Streptomyces longwoodensis]TKT00377.1 ROK family glucokinase [Streptomyces lasalocidi]WRY88178.1 ROK family glucokinase [Streptomyces longwoodensis]WTI47530.1 ROK family glucokinase [Streptomyces longwoodensis]WUC60275.1 ROK family glucokinase [Streptomyces longwoodensis]